MLTKIVPVSFKLIEKQDEGFQPLTKLGEIEFFNYLRDDGPLQNLKKMKEN